MKAGTIVREARRRAGLSQVALAERVGTTQSAIARLERAGSSPSFERLSAIVAACGFDLRLALVPADDADWSLAQENLALDPEARVRQHQAAVRFARAGREAMAGARSRA
jgi:transcriptional regulator with XRE-family HTH domain